MGGGIGVLDYRRTFLKHSCAVPGQNGIMRRTEQTPVMFGKAHAITIVSHINVVPLSRERRSNSFRNELDVGTISVPLDGCSSC